MRIAGTSSRFGLAVALLLGAVRPAIATSTITMVDTAGDVGWYASLAIGADGLGLIAYVDSPNSDLKIAHCSNVPCTAARLSTIDAGSVVEVHGLVVGADCRGLIAYREAGLAATKVAHCNDLPCTSATINVIDTGSTSLVGLAIGSDGLPEIPLTAGRVPGESS